MLKGKHSANEYSKSTSKNKIFKLPIFLFFLIVIFISCIVIYILINNFNKHNLNLNSETKPIIYEDSAIDITRYIEGLEAVQILGVDIKSADTSSKIYIYLKNTSNRNVEPCELIFSVLNENKEKIFGTNLTVPLISPNEEKTLKIFCTDDLSSAIDYEIHL